MNPKIHLTCPQCGYPRNCDSKVCVNCGFSFADVADTVKQGQINEESINAVIGTQPMDIRDIITKLGITDIRVARNLQKLLRKLENSGKLKAYADKGKRFYLK